MATYDSEKSASVISFPCSSVYSVKTLRGELMNSERILFAALVVVAILGAIPQLANPVWLTILVLLGLVGGAMAGNPEPSERVLVYVLAGSLPYFSNNLDQIPAVGAWLNLVLDNLAVGIGGVAVTFLAKAIYGRIVPS